MRDSASLIYQPAGGAGAGGVSGVHQDHRHPGESCFVADKTAELVEAPRVVLSPLALPNPDPLAYPLEVFQGDSPIRALGLQHHLFADAVVSVPAKQGLLAPPLLEESPAGVGALALEPSPELGVTLPQAVDRAAGVGLAIGVGQNIDDAQVNSQHVLGFQQGQLLHVHHHVEVKGLIPERQVGLPLAEGHQLPLAGATGVGDSLAPFHRPDGHPVIREVAENPVVVGDGAVGAERALGLPVPLIAIGDLGDAADGKLGGQGELLADGVVGQLVEVVLPEEPLLPRYAANPVAGSIGAFQSLEQGPMLIGRRQQFEVDHQLHSSSIDESAWFAKLILSEKERLSLSSAA